MKELIRYLESKNLSSATQKAYLRHIDLFLSWYGKAPEVCTAKEIIRYLEYLKEQKGQQNITRRHALIALHHYFTHLLQKGVIITHPTAFIKIRGTQKRSLYRIYSPEELTQLFDNYYNVYVRAYDDSHIPKNQRLQSALSKSRNAVVLSILVHQGVTTKEIDNIQVEDTDLIKATIYIRSCKKSNERTLPLKAEQIGLLMDYLQNIRPQLAEYHHTENNKLFLSLPEYSKKQTDSSSLMHIFKTFTAHVKAIDKNFLNFKQVRASVITRWLKTDGLRKAQYLAGHKYISTTERYIPGNLDSLTEDMEQFNPF